MPYLRHMETSHTLVTTREVATALGCSHRTVLRRVAAGILVPAQKLAGYRGDFLFHPADVEALAAERDR